MGAAMTKYARPVDRGDGVIHMIDVFDPSIYNPRPSWGQTDAALMDRIFEHQKTEWIAAGTWFVAIADAVKDCATFSGGDYMDAGSFANPPPPPGPQPNTPNNPYYGKRPLATKDFYALIGSALDPARFKRLLADSHYLWVGKVIDNVDTVDPDDRAGQFLKIVVYLTSTPGDDGKVLVEAAEIQAIMAIWK